MRRSTQPLWLALILSLFLTACAEETTTPTALPPPEVAVITLKEENVTLNRDLPGRVAASKTAEVRPQISGIIEERLFTEGETVTKGQALYRIDKRLYEADYATAKANLNKAKSQLNIQQVRHNRMSTLMDRKVVSQQEFDESEASLAELKAQISASQAALEKAKINLDYTIIRAPIDGQIGRSNATEGALVTANQAAHLATIRQLDPVYVDMTQSVSSLRELRQAIASGKLKASQDGTIPVQLFFETGGQYDQTGELQFAEAVVGETTGAVTLRALFPNPDGTLLPGMYVRAITPEGMVENAILVPQKTLQRDPIGNASVMTLDDDNKVEIRPVVANRTVGNQWLIESGLHQGDRVIVEGLQKVRPGVIANPVAIETNQANAEGN
ncbi:MAG TPA: efflux RND transporter periplasmic adaptor subunit [Alcanivoracaceae bacterium]|nr:efflux RND transporter periplasmic adaptor subunit [Alcanivoracaceae bacterium]